MDRMVSVIIPTYNGAQKIGRILDALEEQILKDFEVIVAIDGSVDNTIFILENRKPLNYHLRYFFQENKGRASIRNFGAEKAKGDLLVFFDDDIRPEADCLLQHLKHHLNYPGSLAAGKPIEDKNEMRTDVQKYKRYLSLKWYKPLQNTFLQNKGNLFFTAANCSVAVSVFWELGGFDENLRDAEDYDLGRRALIAGKNVFFINDAIGYHDDFISAKSYVIRLRQYREAHELLANSNSEPGGGKVRPFPYKLVLYRMFAFSFWLDLIENELLNWIPKKLRYKLYDVIFTSLSQYFYKVPVRWGKN